MRSASGWSCSHAECNRGQRTECQRTEYLRRQKTDEFGRFTFQRTEA
ncbi:MAG: hypothetical protein LBD06_11105 [Candidatus Accumulibacter sp.]|nr:hypothetical protein [Accumulibacter sp.]